MGEEEAAAASRGTEENRHTRSPQPGTAFPTTTSAFEEALELGQRERKEKGDLNPESPSPVLLLPLTNKQTNKEAN